MDVRTDKGNADLKITVSGEGTVSAVPDMAKATIGVMNEGMDLQEAQQLNAQIASKVLASLYALGIPEKDIQTVEYRIDPIYTYENGKQEFQGYRVTHLFSVTIHNAGNIGAVIDTAVNNGANQVLNIQFSVSNQKALYEHSLSLAVIDSFKKARAIAATLGLGNQLQPASIAEERQRAVPVPVLAMSTEGSAAGTPIEPGQLEIKAYVLAVYTAG